MISTLYFLLLIAFQLWYLTSKQVKYAYTTPYMLNIKKEPERYRIIGILLLLITAALFVMKMGWMSGLCAWLVGLMGIGSLVIMLSPFRYLRPGEVIVLYIICLSLEIFI
jgi:hypothetical protein